MRKSGASWYDKYPKPYLVRRGTAFHWKFKKMLVEQQHSVLKSMIPYILMAKKGTEGLFLEGSVGVPVLVLQANEKHHRRCIALRVCVRL